VAGKLSLCVGMPVMIKNNDATELCITKGQDGTVAGWQESYDEHGQRVLDTHYVPLATGCRGWGEGLIMHKVGGREILCIMRFMHPGILPTA
ncbi:hypothetical protein B0H13DRAFT_1618208, partial [Mycena leptocephala]